MPGFRVEDNWVELLEPQELKRADGRRGVTFARINRDLVVVVLHDGERWARHPAGGIVIVHPSFAPVWCHLEGARYVRTVVGVH